MPSCDCIETDKSADYSDAVTMDNIGAIASSTQQDDGYVRPAYLYQCPVCKRVEIV